MKAIWEWLKALLKKWDDRLQDKKSPAVPERVALAAKYLAEDPLNKFVNPRYIAEIDYSMRSDEKRLALWDRVDNKVTYHKVSHGSGGKNMKPHDGWAREFSNVDGSHMSCLGAFECGETYNGSNGFSMRLDGLMPTNSNARSRAIVVHGADYVKNDNDDIAGRSWGCPAVDHKVAKDLIDKLKGGSLLYTHYNGSMEYGVVPPKKEKNTSGILVVIIGHGLGEDKGAWGVAPLSLHEHPYNTLVAKDMAAYAKERGLSCVVLNKHGSSTAAIGNTASNLVKEFDDKGCVIELHFNSYNSKASGTEVLYDLAEKDNAKFAQIVLNKMVALFKRPNRGIKHSTGRGGSNLASVKCTSCLVEPLFGDNPVEAAMLKDMRVQYAECLVEGAIEYIRGIE